MTPEQLKASILHLAMKGKITEQLKSDGSASDLLPSLNIDSKLSAAEAPFDIPENWLWIPIGNLGATTGTDSFADGPFGSNLKTAHYINEPEVRIIQLSNIGEDGWKDKNVKYTSHKHLDEVIPRCEVFPGDFVIAKMMPAGRTIEVPNLGTRITLGSDAMKFVPNPVLDKKYLLLAMHSQAFLEQVYAEAHGITRVRTTLSGIKSYVLPIPPLEEQHRIVAKIEKLLPYVDKYASSYEKLEHFNAKFPEEMKKSILQYAIQGKLVEQRTEEGTAEELYQQIQEEKQKLIKEGRIKKEKPLAEISEDDIPFDIPDSWKWVKLGDCVSLLGDGLHGTPNYSADGEYSFINGNNLSDGSIVIKSDTKKVSVEEYEKYKKDLNDHSVLVSINGTIGNVAFYSDEKVVLGKSACYFNLIDKTWKEYIYWLIKTDYFLKYAITNATGSTIKNVSLATMKSFLVPLPPVKEQERIVAKIKELWPYCEKLSKT